MIYLDNSATTELAPEVREAMEPFFSGEYGNASSVYDLGTRARVALEQARATIASAIGADAREIVFTASGTESNNAAIKGLVFKQFFAGTPFDQLHAISTRAEHHAVLNPMEFIARLGVQAELLDVDETACISVADVQTALRSNTTLASFMLVNNETGGINSIAEITDVIRAKSGALVHTDAVQAFGKMPINVRKLGVDLLSVSAHKLHGPKGIGALFTRSGIQWEPLLHGGAQERNRRGGTESVASAVGFAMAVELAMKHLEATRSHLRALKEHLLRELSKLPGVRLNGDPSRTIESIVNFSFAPDVLEAIDGEALLMRFDLEGIAVSNGSACTSGSLQPSHVLLAAGKGKEVASKSIRVSFSRYTPIHEVDVFLHALTPIIPALAK